MSRHRSVRNLDLDEELADDYGYDEDPYGERPSVTMQSRQEASSANPHNIASPENLEPNDRKSLESSYATILDVLGPPDSANNPFSEREIKDALWDAYFDTETVLDDLIKEAEKRKKKKQGESYDQCSGCQASGLSGSSWTCKGSVPAQWVSRCPCPAHLQARVEEKRHAELTIAVNLCLCLSPLPLRDRCSRRSS